MSSPGTLSLDFSSYPAQGDFLSTADRHAAFVGGYGAGKTLTACRKAITLAALNQGCSGIMCAPTYRMLRDTLWRRFQKVLEESGIDFVKRISKMEIYIPVFRHRVLFRGADKPGRLKGHDVSWFLLDEAGQVSEEVHNILLSRIRETAAGHLFGGLVGTPEGYGWFYDVTDGPSAFYSLSRMSTAANQDLDRQYVERLVESFTEQQREAYLEGRFVDLQSGRVYSEFSRSDHVQAFEFRPVGPLVHSIDFNVDPACSSVGWREGSGFRVWDEIHIEGGCNSYEVADEFVRRFADWPGEVIVKGDATGSARKSSALASDYRILAEAYLRHFGERFIGVDVPRSNPYVTERINSVGGAFRRGDVRIHPQCTHTLDDLERVVWKTGTRAPDASDRMRTHHTDALGYWIFKDAPIKRPERHETKRPSRQVRGTRARRTSKV